MSAFKFVLNIQLQGNIWAGDGHSYGSAYNWQIYRTVFVLCMFRYNLLIQNDKVTKKLFQIFLGHCVEIRQD
jgi:hypothetical protein